MERPPHNTRRRLPAAVLLTLAVALAGCGTTQSRRRSLALPLPLAPQAAEARAGTVALAAADGSDRLRLVDSVLGAPTAEEAEEVETGPVAEALAAQWPARFGGIFAVDPICRDVAPGLAQLARPADATPAEPPATAARLAIRRDPRSLREAAADAFDEAASGPAEDKPRRRFWVRPNLGQSPRYADDGHHGQPFSLGVNLHFQF